jgi:hypothetical protein
MAISERRLEAMMDWPTVSDVFVLVQEVRAQRALLEQARAYVVGVRPTLGERVEMRNRIDAAIRGEVPEAH